MRPLPRCVSISYQSQSSLRQPYKGNFREWQKSKEETKQRNVTEGLRRGKQHSLGCWSEASLRRGRKEAARAKIGWRAQQRQAPGGGSKTEHLRGRVKVMWLKWCFRCDGPRPATSASRGNFWEGNVLGSHARVRNSGSAAQPCVFNKPSRWFRGTYSVRATRLEDGERRADLQEGLSQSLL